MLFIIKEKVDSQAARNDLTFVRGLSSYRIKGLAEVTYGGPRNAPRFVITQSLTHNSFKSIHSAKDTPKTNLGGGEQIIYSLNLSQKSYRKLEAQKEA